MFAPWTWFVVYLLGDPVGVALQDSEDTPICEASLEVDEPTLAALAGAPDMIAVAEHVMWDLGNYPVEYECMRMALVLSGREEWRTGPEEVIDREDLVYCGIENP